MSIYIDSANIGDVREAMKLGYVRGVTTNPLLFARTNGDWREGLKAICDVVPGEVFYQIDTPDPKKFFNEAREIYKISPKQIILKVPAVPEYFALVAKISTEIPCCMTAVYSESQLVAASAVGAIEVAVYVGRITRFYNEKRGGLPSDGTGLVSSMRDLIDGRGLQLKILAASIKSPEDLVESVRAGAHDVTTSLDVLKSLGSHPLSEEALKEFNAVL